MWWIILIFLFVVQGNTVKTECGLKNIQCVNETSFIFCRNVGDTVVTFGKLTHCNEGYGCHESIGFYPCEKKENLPVITTTTPKPTCSIEANHNKKMPLYKENIQDCSQYLTCESNLFFFWDLKEKSCPTGTGFSTSQSDCVRWIDPKTCQEIEVPSTTTTRPIPNCDAQKNEVFEYYDGNVKNCGKYYECVRTVVWWELKTRNCPTGTGFSIEAKSCVADISPETCLSTGITTSAPEESTTEIITPAPTAPPTPNCDDQKEAFYPYYEKETNQKNCKYFYKCEWALIWYNLNKKTCPSGTGFSDITLQCESGISPETCLPLEVSATNPDSTTKESGLLTEENVTEQLATTESEKPSISTTEIKRCNCYKSRKCPFYDEKVKNCRKYFECGSYFWFWTDLYVNTCPSGTGFSEETLTCERNISPDTCEPITESFGTTKKCPKWKN